ncbi:MAG: Gfo/Idh/MocA family oxidoreductase [Clostridiales bacterium]|nr:Gfo/Idh/MocA family oxidoreductase [Clostridiales bacterium]
MSEPIRIGVVGLGRIGMSVHLDCLKARPDKFRVVAACDLIPERTEKYADVFGCKRYGDINDLINDPEVEVVDIATRSCDHYAHSKMALLAGKSVLVEKPFCRTYAEACELNRLGSQPSGPRIFVRHNRRFEEGFIKVNEIIDSGLLGEVYEIKLTRNGYQRRNDWQTIKEFGGGQLLNWGPHIVDHALRFCGGGYESMTAEIRRVAAVGDAEDHIKLVFRGVNKRIVDMEISGGAAIPTPEYIVYGTKGGLIEDKGTLRWKYLDPDVPLKDIKADPSTPDGGTFGNSEKLVWKEDSYSLGSDKTDVVWDYFYDAYRNHKPYPITPDQAAEVVKVLENAKIGTEFADSDESDDVCPF